MTMANQNNEMDAPRGAFAKIESVINAAAARSDTITLGELSDQMEERAFGLLLLVLSLPCCLPFVYLLPQIVALPMSVLSTQMASGRAAPWLPETLRKRTMRVDSISDVIARSKKYGGWLETLAHPRLVFMTGPRATRIVGGLLTIPCLSVLVPLPLTNTVPGFGVALTSVGLIERDGLFVGAGLIVGLAWVALLVIGGPALIYWLVSVVSGG